MNTYSARFTADPVDASETPGQAMMLAIHDALRRDLGRLVGAADQATHDDAMPWTRVHAGWELFRSQLYKHHTFEDTHLWPRLRTRLERAGESTEVLADMEAEHHRVDEWLATVGASFDASSGQCPERAADVKRLAEALCTHLAHEEQDVLPLLVRQMTSADHKDMARIQRREQGLRGAAEFLPWAMDGVSAARADIVLRVVPLPGRVLFRHVWQPRYERRRCGRSCDVRSAQPRRP
jgi:iron-sulfur cluster repair protein YtfE (RIC family)